MKCILHIGTEKTGTTLLQEWLYHNITSLSKCGIYLSEIIGKPNNQLVPAYFSNRLYSWAKSKGISSLSEKKKFFEGFLSSLSLEIEDASKKHQYFLISAEHMHSQLRTKNEIENLHNFLQDKFDSIDIHCYFRNQYDLAISRYSTALKGSSVKSLDMFLNDIHPDNYYYNYGQIADNWKAVFGELNCKFSIYDKAMFIKGDIRKDLIAKIDRDIDCNNFDYSITAANVSLTYLQAVAFKTININFPRFNSNSSGVSPINQQLKQAVLNIDSLKLGKIESHRRKEIEEIFRNINEYFFQENFGSSNKFITASGDEPMKSKERERLIKLGILLDDTLMELLTLLKNPLQDQDACYLRDIALKIFKRSPENLNDALSLMKLAKRARPQGKFIEKKVDEWSKMLSQDL